MNRAKLLAARLRASEDRPYLASALFALTIVPTEHVPTMGVDRHWRCYVNPSFVDEHAVPELAAVWIHEVSHLLREHHRRAENLPAEYRADPYRVNLAQDCEINDDLVADGLPLPGSPALPATFALAPGRLFEQYLPGIPPTRSTRVNCGSGAHGVAQLWDVPPGAVASVSPTEAGSLRRLTASRIRDHLRRRGHVPAGWQRWAQAVLEPTVDWRQVLAGSVRRAVGSAAGAVDYSYRRPSRRSASQPRVVLPSLRRPLPAIAVVIDTSESMSEDDLADAVAEVVGVLRGVGVSGNRVTVLACDAAVHVAQRVSTVEQLTLAGGGGTDLRVGIAAALAGTPRPDIVIVLTDGATPWPETPVAARVIAGLIGATPPPPPPWIEAVRIGDAA